MPRIVLVTHHLDTALIATPPPTSPPPPAVTRDLPPLPPTPPGVNAADHDRLARLVRTLDSSIRVPFTNRHVGWDAILGLVPVVGDASGLVFSGSVISQSVRLGARGWTLVNMLLRAVLDAAIGLIPIAGQAFDFFYKANERNLRLLDEHLRDPDATRDSSRTTVLLSLGLVGFVILAALMFMITAAAWLVSRLF